MQAFFSFFRGKKGGRIVPGYPGIGVLTNSCVMILTYFVLNITQQDRINRIEPQYLVFHFLVPKLQLLFGEDFVFAFPTINTEGIPVFSQ